MTADLVQLERLEAGLRASAESGREVIDALAFTVFASITSDDYLLSLAVPNDDPDDWAPSIDALRRAYRARGRRARLEYMSELHPTLAPALEAAGFQREISAPVMTLVAGDLGGPASPAGLAYRPLTAAEPERLEAFLRGQNVAYGGVGDEGSMAWYPQLMAGLESGTVMAAALERDGRPVAGASIVTGGGAGELAGVWTAPGERRQGFGYAVCQRLLADYFAAGHELCWLSAAEGALSVYARLGYRRVGTQLNYADGRTGRPATPPATP